MKAPSVKIVIKPKWLSWDSIQEVVYEAHALNRGKGILMRKPSLSAEEIRGEIDGKGIMLVALDGDKLVATAALLKKEISSWYHKGMCGYMCFVAVLPSYTGKGVYKQLSAAFEDYARQQGLKGIYFDTHYKNRRMLRSSEKGGYRRVGVRNCGSHWNVIMYKRIVTDANLSSVSCRTHFLYNLIKLKLYRVKKKLIG